MKAIQLSRSDTLEFFNGDELATDVFLKKYALTNGNGVIEEYLPTQMWLRLAKAAASVEKHREIWQTRFYEILSDWKAVPQGSIMFALGNPHQKSSASNCFVLPINDDSLDGIFDCAKNMSKTYAYRGGVGIDISNLRPEGALVSNAARTSTGAWSFMDFYSYVTRMIGQHGRRGALMITISDRHPDLVKFITAKKDKLKVTGANISVRISDDFMSAVERDDDWEMSFTTNHETITKVAKARELWDLIISTATETAEPGIIFWDNVLRESPADCYADVGFRSQTTNPCSELPLAHFDACTLLSMNLTKYTRYDFTEQADFDWDSFINDVRFAVRFQDNVKEIDLKLMPLKKQREVAAQGRRLGMGTHGLADTLANLRIQYDSEEGLQFVSKLYETYAKAVYQASVDLAKEKGAFPIFDAKKEKGHPFLERIGFAGVPRRNIALLTCAPTGSVSCLCQTSSGLEPVFRNFYTRRRKITHNESLTIAKEKLFVDKSGDYWQEYDVAHRNVQRYLNMHDLSMNAELPPFFVESHKIDWINRVRLQAAIQRFTDHSISSTCNLPSGTSTEIVKQIYAEAHKQGCKGFTVYVDGCRDGVLLTNDCDDCIKKTQAPKRPKELMSDVYHINVKGELYFVVVGLYKGEPYEVFAGENGVFNKDVKKARVIKKKRGHYEAVLDDGSVIPNLGEHITDEQAAITRLISLALRHGADISHCVTVLERVPGDMHNLARSLARALKKYIPNGASVTGQACDACGSENLKREMGCVTCVDCGNSRCG